MPESFNPWAMSTDAEGGDEAAKVTHISGAKSKGGRPTTPRYDPDGYDRSKLYVASTNGHDHAIEKRVRFDPQVAGMYESFQEEMATRLVARGKNRLVGKRDLTLADVARNAFTHDLHYWASMGYEVNGDLLAIYTAEGDRNRRDLENDTRAGFLDGLKDSLERARIENRWRDVSQFVESSREAVARMPEPYHEQGVGMLARYEAMIPMQGWVK